jgi:hypothetical protein
LVSPVAALEHARNQQSTLAQQQLQREQFAKNQEAARQQMTYAQQRAKLVADINAKYANDPKGKVQALLAAGLTDTAKELVGIYKTQGVPGFVEEKDTRTSAQKDFAEAYPDMVDQKGRVKDDKVSSAAFRDYQLGLAEKGSSKVDVTVEGKKEMGLGAKKYHEAMGTATSTWLLGGRANALKNISQLEETLSVLESDKKVVGGLIGFTPDAVLALFNQDAIAAKENVQQVVSESLKDILGAQFTEKEGERLMARAYNPKLDAEENAKKVYRLLKQLKIAADTKDQMAKYFQDNNFSMEGWNFFENSPPSRQDFYYALNDKSLDPAPEEIAPAQAPAPAAPQAQGWVPQARRGMPQAQGGLPPMPSMGGRLNTGFVPTEADSALLNKYLPRN